MDGGGVRVLACGSRTFEDQAKVWKALDDLLNLSLTGVTIIHGAARGADSLAAEWAGSRRCPVEAFPADWKKYGKRAGYVRNRQMLDEGNPDLVLAFVDKPLHESRGTKMMVDIARMAGVMAKVYSPDFTKVGGC